jgi:membrane protease YdiL (CAAX protease family)
MAAYPLLIGLVGVSGNAVRGPALSNGAKGLLGVCAVQLGVFGLVLALAWLASRASRDELLWRWRGGFWPLPLGMAYSVAIRLMLGLIVVAVGLALIGTGLVTTDKLQEFSLANRPDVEAIVDVSAMKYDSLYYWLTLTLVSFVVAGLREEVWRGAFIAGMRGLWPGVFGSRAGQIAAVVLAAVIFGVGHLGQGVLAASFAGLLGIGLGLIMVLHRSIWPAVIAHGMFDATSLALIPWAVDKLHELQKSLGH